MNSPFLSEIAPELRLALQDTSILTRPFVVHPESEALWRAHIKYALPLLRSDSLAATTRRIPPITDRSAKGCVVIVETRRHPWFEFVLRNYAFFVCGRGWSLLLVHGSENGGYLRDLTAGWESVGFFDLGLTSLTLDGFNRLLTSAPFWRAMPHECILFAQCDTMAWDGAHRLEEFMGYSYAGAPWWPLCPVCSTVHRSGGELCGHLKGQAALHAMAPHLTGNGGLSLRKRSAMLAVIERFLFGATAADAEDAYFALGLAELAREGTPGIRICPVETAERFAIEAMFPRSIPREGPPAFGAHKSYAYLHPRALAFLLDRVRYNADS